MSSSEKIEIREDKCHDTQCSEAPEKKSFLFHHPQINQKESKSIESMEDENKEKEEVKASILMKSQKPGDSIDPSYQSISGEDF
jgi:hypothetical protein